MQYNNKNLFGARKYKGMQMPAVAAPDQRIRIQRDAPSETSNKKTLHFGNHFFGIAYIKRIIARRKANKLARINRKRNAGVYA